MADGCTTTLIPYGAGDDLLIPPGDTSTAFYASGFSGASDHSDIIAAHTTDATGVLSSDDTATYATMDQGGFGADMVARYGADPGAGYSIETKARQDPAVTIPDGYEITEARIVATYRASASSGTFGAHWTAYTPDYPTGGSNGPPTFDLAASSGDWVRAVSDAFDPAFLSVNQAYLSAALASRSATIQLQSFAHTGTVDVAFLGLQLTYCPTVAPPVSAYIRKSSIRQLQRGGAGGLGGIPRGYGVSTARGSLRRGPGAIR